MADTINTGSVPVSSLNQNQLVIDMENDVKKLYNDAAIFKRLTQTISGITKADRMEHRYREDRLQSITTVVTAAAAANATSIAVSAPKLGSRNQVIYCPATGETFSMDEDVGGTAVAGAIKVRGEGSATGTGITNPIPAGSVLLFLLESHAEGEAVPPAFSTVETDYSTYIMQYDETYKITDIATYEKKYGEEERAKQHMKKWIALEQRLNLHFYVGNGYRETASSSSGTRRHGLRGLFSYLAARNIDASQIQGGLTLQTLGLLLRPTKQYKSGMMPPVMLCGQNLWNSISAFPSGTIRINEPGASDITWGVTISKLNTPFGVINVAYDQMLSQEFGLADRGVMIQPEHIKQLEMNGLPMRLMTNRQAPADVHNILDIFTGTRGLQVELPELHRSISGVN